MKQVKTKTVRNNNEEQEIESHLFSDEVFNRFSLMCTQNCTNRKIILNDLNLGTQSAIFIKRLLFDNPGIA